MIVNTPISIGELLDKISILLIKEKKITDQDKLNLVCNELSLLKEILEDSLKDKSYTEYLDKLVNINTKLWNIEDDIRNHERNNNFNEDFIKLARSVYITNDKRSEIKFEINKKFGSKILEVKSYEKY